MRVFLCRWACHCALDAPANLGVTRHLVRAPLVEKVFRKRSNSSTVVLPKSFLPLLFGKVSGAVPARCLAETAPVVVDGASSSLSGSTQAIRSVRAGGARTRTRPRRRGPRSAPDRQS